MVILHVPNILDAQPSEGDFGEVLLEQKVVVCRSKPFPRSLGF